MQLRLPICRERCRPVIFRTDFWKAFIVWPKKTVGNAAAQNGILQLMRKRWHKETKHDQRDESRRNTERYL